MQLLNVTTYALQNKRKELLGAIQMVASQTHQEIGCRNCRVYQDQKNRNRISIEQEWADKQSLNGYFRSDHFRALIGAMKWLGTSFEVRINNGSPYESWELVQKKGRLSTF